MNREYKSDVFSLLMKKPEYALQVYNALNGTNYENEELIEILQLEKGIFEIHRQEVTKTAMLEYTFERQIEKNI